MENDSNQQLERLIQRELEKLSELPAPDTLILRVNATIEARAKVPSWRQGWSAWPFSLKIAASVAMINVMAGILFGTNWAAAQLETRPVPQPFVHWWDAFASTGALLSTLGHALLIVCRAIGEPWLLGIVAIIVVMYLACVGLGTACFCVAARKR